MEQVEVKNKSKWRIAPSKFLSLGWGKWLRGECRTGVQSTCGIGESLVTFKNCVRSKPKIVLYAEVQLLNSLPQHSVGPECYVDSKRDWENLWDKNPSLGIEADSNIWIKIPLGYDAVGWEGVT